MAAGLTGPPKRVAPLRARPEGTIRARDSGPASTDAPSLRIPDDDSVRRLLAGVADGTLVLSVPSGSPAELPTSGRDVDCAVRGMDRMWPLRMRDGWRLCQLLHYDLCSWFWILDRDGGVVAIDTTEDPLGLGRYAFPTERFVGEGVASAEPPQRAAYLTLKRLRKADRSAAAWAALGRLARVDAGSYVAAVEAAGGRRVARLVARASVDGNPPSPSAVRRARALLRIRRFRSPRRIAEALARGAARELERITRPTGLVVLVAGPDGAGKSMLAERLPGAAEGLFRRYDRIHWKAEILPRPGAVVGREMADTSRPHAQATHGRVVSLLLTGYHWIDFLLSGLLKVAPRRIRTGLVVVERGWWDIAVDPSRYRLDVPAWLIKALGTVLPAPDIAFVLEAEPSVLRSRKEELPEDELARQLNAWRSVLPNRVSTFFLDASRDPATLEREAREAIVGALERRALSRLGAGWAALPARGSSGRWVVPRGPRASARRALDMYQPMNTKGRVWRVASRIAASAGALRLLPRAQAPPQAVREILSPYLAPRSAVAVGRANHPNRFLALVVPDDAAPSMVKVAADPGADDALEREVRAIQRWGSRLPPPLAAPTVMAREPGVLVLKGVEWVARPRPWRLEEEVARALGVFFSEQAGGGETGPAHGDFAPWNILRTRGGWLVIDWEAAIPEAPPLYDLFHWMVQAHLHLGRPSQAELFHGIREGPGWVGGAIRAYGAGAGIDAADAWARFRDHLSLSAELLGRAATPPSDDIEGRRRLLAEAES